MSLFGLALFDHDSGQHRGGRRIHGGRSHPGHLLYTAATTTIRCGRISKARYERLRSKGKPPRVSLVTVMCKLVSLFTALPREDRLWQPEAPYHELEAAA